MCSVRVSHAARGVDGGRCAMDAARAGILNSAEASIDHHVGPAATERRLRRLVAETWGTREAAFPALVSLLADLAVDSLDFVALALRIEELFDVSLPERLLAAVGTYGDLGALVVARVQYPVSVAAEPML